MTNKKSNSALVVVFFTIFIDLLGFGIVLPLSPYYAEHFGASAAVVGLLQASYSLMQFLFAPLWGRISDRVGRRPIILMSIFGGFVSFAIFSMAGSLTLLFVSRMLQGIFGANISATQAYVADVTTEKDRSKGMGMVGAAFGLGFVLGPAIGAQLGSAGGDIGALIGMRGVGPFGMGFPAFVAALMCLANFCLAYFKLKESLTPELKAEAARKERKGRFHIFARSLKQRDLGWLIMTFFVAGFAQANLESTLALFAEAKFGFGIRDTGHLFAVVGLVIVFMQGFLIRKLLPKFGERKLILWGPALVMIGYAYIAVSGSPLQLYLANIVLAVGGGLASPAILGAISLVTSKTEQGEVLGLTQSLGSLARILGPIIGGTIFASVSPSAPYWLASGMVLVAVIIIAMNASHLPNAGKETIRQ